MPGILPEGGNHHRLVEPAPEVLYALWEVPVVQSDCRLDPYLQQGIDQVVVVLYTFRVGGRIQAGGLNAGPGEGETVVFDLVW